MTDTFKKTDDVLKWARTVTRERDIHNCSLSDQQARTANEQRVAVQILSAIQHQDDLERRIDKAIDLAIQFQGTDGAHHKDWVIDQMVRALAGENYQEIVSSACDGPDGENTYQWDEGIPP